MSGGTHWKKSGWNLWTPVEYAGVRWIPPDKTWQFGPCHTDKDQQLSLVESGGICWIPIGHVGQCTVLRRGTAGAPSLFPGISRFSNSDTSKMCTHFGSLLLNIYSYRL